MSIPIITNYIEVQEDKITIATETQHTYTGGSVTYVILLK